jgi:MFS family permease
MSTVALGPAYGRLLAATALSNVGDGIRAAAIPLLAASLTGRPELVAGVAVVAQLPWLLLGLLAGAVVDRVDRRRLLACVDLARAALLAVLVAAIATGSATIWLLFAVAFAAGVGETLRDTAAATLVPALVPPERLDRANGRLLTAEVTGNELVGPALGGTLFAVAAFLPFAVNGGALAAAALLVLALPDVFRPVPVPPDPSLAPSAGHAGPVRRSLRREVAEGLRWLARHRLLRLVTGLAVLLAALDAAWFAILVLYVEQAAGVTAAGFGLLLAVSALGAIAGGLVADTVTARISLGAALALSVAVTGAAQLVLGLSSLVTVIAAALALSGFAFSVANVAIVTLRQRATPARLLGRVTATYRTIAGGAVALGALVGGIAAASFGVRAPMLAGAPVLIGAGLLALLPLKRRTEALPVTRPAHGIPWTGVTPPAHDAAPPSTDVTPPSTDVMPPARDPS